MAGDLQVDTQQIRVAAGHLDEAVAVFRRVASEPPVDSFAPNAFGPGGAAVEVAAQIVRRLRHGSECAEQLARRSRQLGDNLRTVAARFDELEATLAGGAR